MGKTFVETTTGAPVFRARRTDADLLNAGSDFDETKRTFKVGLGDMVKFDHQDFIGGEALENSEKQC